MSQLDTLRLKLDDWRVRQHFKRVEYVLRARDVSHLPATLQRARAHHLNTLHTYAARGVFPRNHERSGYAPCFIDRDGRECAVAHLVMMSGHSEAAQHIASVANYAYVPQMNFPELDEWAAGTGLSEEELALIQPSYDPCDVVFGRPELCQLLADSARLLFPSTTLWLIGIGAIVINAIGLALGRLRIIAASIGVVAAVFVLVYGLTLLRTFGTLAPYLPRPGIASLIRVSPNMVYPYQHSGSISLGIAFVSIGLSAYSVWRFVRARHKNRQQFVGGLKSQPQQFTGS